MLKKLLSSIIVGLVMTVSAQATGPVLNDGIEDYWVGYVTYRGYTWRDGYWWKDGNGYTRHKVYYTRYDYRGCPYQDWYVEYVLAYTPSKVTYSAGWRDKLLDTIHANQVHENEQQAKALDHAAFTQTIEAAVNAKLLRPNQVIAMPFANHYGDLYQAGTGYGGLGYAAGGNTLYSYNQVRDWYGDTNMNVLYQQAQRLGQQSLQNGSQATSEFNGLVKSAGDAVATVSEIQAKTQGLLALSNAIKPEPRSKTTTTINGTAVAPLTMPKAEDAVAPALLNVPLSALFQNDCSKCHSGPQAKNGFTFDKLKAMDDKQLAVVWDKLTSGDMPRDQNNKGQMLDTVHLGMWLKELVKLKK